MKKPMIVALSIALVILVACGGGGKSSAPSETLVGTPTDVAADTACGEWSKANGSAGSAVTQQYGEIRECERYADTYVINTLGINEYINGVFATESARGVVGLYRCANTDTLCRDGRNDHPLSGWTFYSPPYPGGVTVLQALDENRLIVDNGGRQICFNISTAAFVVGPC